MKNAYLFRRADKKPTLVLLIRVLEDVITSGISRILVRDIYTGEEFECKDYDVDTMRPFNELEVLAWAADDRKVGDSGLEGIGG